MKKRGVDFNKIEKELLKNPKLREEFEKRDVVFDIAQMIKEARLLMGYTQTKLARLMKTQQTSISRAESGKSSLSISFLEKMAEALGTYLIPPRFGSMYTEGVKRIISDNKNASEQTEHTFLGRIATEDWAMATVTADSQASFQRDSYD